MNQTARRATARVMEQQEARIADTERRLDELDRWRLALESLTPQGSEFVNDLDACMAYIEKRRQSDHETLKKALREKKDTERRLRIAVDALQHYADIDPWERLCVADKALAQIRGGATEKPVDTSRASA